MLFGLPEMKVFAETSSDPRIKALWARLKEARKKNALWCEEVNTLREQLRWRKWPEEKPEETGRNPYTVVLGCDCVQATFSFGRWLMDERMSFEDVADMVTHWRPIGPLAGGE